MNYRNRILVCAAASLLLYPCGGGAPAADSVPASQDKKEKPAVEPSGKTPELTREYLLAHGFKQSDKDADSFVAENVRLGDVAATLGFNIASLRRPANQSPRSDSRWGVVQAKRFSVSSHESKAGSPKSDFSLDRPDVVCTAQISLKKYVPREPPKPPLRTDSNPRLSIKSVTVPKDRMKPIQVTFEVAADGKLPLGLLAYQFKVRIADRDECLYMGTAEFLEAATSPLDKFLVKPGSPLTLTVSAPDELMLVSDDWDGLGVGKHRVQITIEGPGTMKGVGFDYMWNDGNPDDRKVESKESEFTVK